MINKSSILIDFVRGLWDAGIRHNQSRVAARLRQRAYGTNCIIDTGVVIIEPKAFHAGAHTALYHGTYILNTYGCFALGANSHLGAYSYVNVCYGNVEIGEGTAIGPHTQIIAYSNHYAPGGRVAEERITADISIGNNVFIGANCVILPGSRIADNVIVGANSLVKGNLTSDAIYAGSPCRQISTGWFSSTAQQEKHNDVAHGLESLSQ